MDLTTEPVIQIDSLENKMNLLLISSLVVLIITLIVYVISRLMNIYGVILDKKKSDNIILNTKIGIGSTV